MLLSCLCTLHAALAQEGDIQGFAQVNFAVRTTDAPGTEADVLLGDERVQLELSRYSESGSVSFDAKIDFFHDAVAGRGDLEVRETYLTLTAPQLDLRVGRQVVTWGVGDLIFITDVFPKDWTALLSGRPLEYLKVGSDAVNLSIYAGALSAQLIAVPFFEPDRLPQGRRLVGYDPFPGVPRQVAEPRPTVGNAELALRVSRYIGAVDAALYAYRGYWRSPPGQRFDGERVERFHPQLSVYAATVQGGLLSGVLSLEGGLYDSRQDRSGTDAAVENSQARLLVGYQRAFGDDLTVGLQYYREQMLDYESYGQTLPPDLPRRSETRHNATLRLTRLFAYQTVRASFFVWASPNEEDFYANPEVRYSVTDEMWAAVGANLFGGADEHTFFGQFDDNDNIYGTLRYGF